jgi:hypothetical protein
MRNSGDGFGRGTERERAGKGGRPNASPEFRLRKGAELSQRAFVTKCRALAFERVRFPDTSHCDGESLRVEASPPFVGRGAVCLTSSR